MRINRHRCVIGDLQITAEQIGQAGARALVRNMQHARTGVLFKHGTNEMRQTTDAGRTIGNALRLGLGLRDEFLQVVGFERATGHHDQGPNGEQADGRDAIDRIVGQFVERRIHTITRRHQTHRVAVGVGTYCEFSTDGAATAGVIIHNKILTELFGELLAQRARDDVGAATGAERHNQTDRFGRPLRFGRHSGQRYRGKQRNRSLRQSKDRLLHRYRSSIGVNRHFTSDATAPHCAESILRAPCRVRTAHAV